MQAELCVQEPVDVQAIISSALPITSRHVNTYDPISISIPQLHEEIRAANQAYCSVPEILGKRVQFRIGFDLWLPHKGRWQYKRLQGVRILLNAPNAEQAQLAIDAILAFAQSLNGKTLAPEPLTEDKK